MIASDADQYDSGTESLKQDEENVSSEFILWEFRNKTSTHMHFPTLRWTSIYC